MPETRLAVALKLVAAALVYAAIAYVGARMIRGPMVGWQGPAIVAAVVIVEGWYRYRRANAKRADGDKPT